MLSTPVDEISEGRLRTDPAAAFKAWCIPQCPFLMECSCSVLEQIRREVEEARHSNRGERETGGVLYGIHESGRTRILTCRPLQCEHAMGSGFVLSQKDEKRLAHLISAPATDPELKGLQALGWYHSHLRSKIFLSERDRQIHFRHFDAPFQIALVIRPESERPARAGFFFREATGEFRTESSYEEFAIETAPPSAPEPKQAVVSKQASAHRRTSTPAKPGQQQTEAICPRCGSQNIQKSRRTGPLERVCGLVGFYPYRCRECLSRTFLKTSDVLERARGTSRKRPEERRRAWQRTRREMLLWGGAILGFVAILYYLALDSGPKPDPPSQP